MISDMIRQGDYVDFLASTCLNFDGSTIRVQSAEAALPGATWPYAVFAWVRPTDTDESGVNTLFFNGRTNNGANYLACNYRRSGFETKFELQVRASNDNRLETSLAYANDQWYRICFYAESDTMRQIWVNKAKAAQGVDAQSQPGSSSSRAIALGLAVDSSPSGQFLGQLADVQIWDLSSPLTTEDIEFDYDNPDRLLSDRGSISRSDLVAAYGLERLPKTVPASLIDDSGNGVGLTLSDSDTLTQAEWDIATSIEQDFFVGNR